MKSVSISVTLGESDTDELIWRYSLDFIHTDGEILKNQVKIQSEEVYHFPTREKILDRAAKENSDSLNRMIKRILGLCR